MRRRNDLICFIALNVLVLLDVLGLFAWHFLLAEKMDAQLHLNAWFALVISVDLVQGGVARFDGQVGKGYAMTTRLPLDHHSR